MTSQSMPTISSPAVDEIAEIARQAIAGGAQQVHGEFAWLLQKIAELKSRRLGVEIGVHVGASYSALSRFFDRMILVDPDLSKLRFPIRSQDCLKNGSSSDIALTESVENDIDFLLIDGDHSYPAVSSDFHIWIKKMAPGGIVALHDIRGVDTRGERDGVSRFWAKLKASGEHRTEEIMLHPRFYGIGIVRT